MKILFCNDRNQMYRILLFPFKIATDDHKGQGTEKYINKIILVFLDKDA